MRKATFKVELDGVGTVTINTNKDHIATGGEGSVFRFQNTAIKIYLDERKVGYNDVATKVHFFKNNHIDYVVYPKGLVLEQGKTVGCYMDFVKGEPLPRVFTNDYRIRSGFSGEVELVKKMREVVEFAHSHNAIMVDDNELGWFLLSDGSPRIIDVDSWVLHGRFPPSVSVMPSIRDWHTQGWNEESDWFAWGVVTFQVFTGLHPYRGILNGFKPGEMERRMKENKSVFTSGIRLNPAVRDFSIIPKNLLDWYRSIFQDGIRTAPPNNFDKGDVVKAAVTLRTRKDLTIEKIYDDKKIVRLFSCGYGLTDQEELVDIDSKAVMHVGGTITPESKISASGTVAMLLKDRCLSWATIESNKKYCSTVIMTDTVDGLIEGCDHFFTIKNDKIYRIETHKIGLKTIIGTGMSWDISPNSIRWFSNIGIQDVLGAKYVVFPDKNYCIEFIRVKDLDRIVAISSINSDDLIIIVGETRTGEYKRVTMQKEKSRWNIQVSAVDSPELNMVIMQNGLVVEIVDTDLVLWDPYHNKKKVIKDCTLTQPLQICGGRVMYLENGTVWQISTR